jgi:hypothetical protein|tara:strand:+ start:301 stop:615 length:315 start_codon:yes stop_codon:yes gene_type:complete
LASCIQPISSQARAELGWVELGLAGLGWAWCGLVWFGLAGLGFFSGIIRENYEFLPILYFTFSPMNFTTPPTSDAISKQKATMTPISPLKSTIAFRLTLPPPHF